MKQPSPSRRFVREINFAEKKGFIHPEDFNKLRDDDEFIDLLRVMRLCNVLSYVIELVLAAKDTTVAERRARTRNSFNTGGYLHEGVVLLDKLATVHLGRTYFIGFRKILAELTPAERKILQLLRNNAAFHLDYKDYSTRQALQELKLTEYEFFEKEGEKVDNPRDIYFRLPDTVDLNYVLDRIKEDERSDPTTARSPEIMKDESSWEIEIQNEISVLTGRLSAVMQLACLDFIGGLSKRKGLFR